MSHTKQRGFTVLELVVVIIFLAAMGTVFIINSRNMQINEHDSQRKTAINAMYYNLEDVYYAAHGSYPQAITADQLPGIDPTNLKDPEGVAVGQQNSDYSYKPKDCTNGACKSYVLRANMENQSDYSRNSRNK